MTKGIALLLAGSAAVLALPAQAQDDRAFSGPWVAGVGGYDQTKAGSTADDDTNENNDESAEGVVWGGAAGYDVDLGTMVIGAEAELTESTADTNSRDGDPEGFGLGSVEAGRPKKSTNTPLFLASWSVRRAAVPFFLRTRITCGRAQSRGTMVMPVAFRILRTRRSRGG